MTHRQTVKRLATAMAAGGVLAIAPVAIPAASAAPADCVNYPVPTPTTILLSVSPANPGVGDPFTTTVSVLTAGEPVDGGNVIFTYAGQTRTVPVNAGTASATFIAEEGRFALSARYVGQCLDDGTAIDPGTDTQPMVAGVAAFGGGNGGGGNGGSHNVGAARPGATIGGVSGVSGGSGGSGSGSTAGTLASTGVDSQTELYGLLGLGLVTVGGLTLMVHRRRVQG